MLPARERLHPGDAARLQGHQWLEVNLQTAFRQGPPEVPLHLFATLEFRVHAGPEYAEDAALLRFGAIQRDVGLAQQQRWTCVPVVVAA